MPMSRIFAALAILLPLPALAQPAQPPAAPPGAPVELGHFGGWTAYSFPDGKRDSCYALAGPSKPDDGLKQRAKPNLMVTHRPAEKTFNVVSINMGIDLPANGSADVAVGKASFDFFTKEHSAWSRDADTDKAVVTAMAAGQELTVKLKAYKGKPVVDTYSLQGFPQALAAIDKACKYRR
jgi:hypothetical protein